MSVILKAGITVVAVVLVGALANGHRHSPTGVRYDFGRGVEGWTALPPPAGVPTTVEVTHSRADGVTGAGALKVHYRTEEHKLAAIVHAVDGIAGLGVRVRLKTDSAATLVLGLIEGGGASYMHVVQSTAGKWLELELPFTAFTLSSDSKDPDGRLDLDQVRTLVVGDAGGFMPGAGTEQTLWVERYEVSSDLRLPEPERYLPLLDTGIESPSGARATSGVRYLPGRHGLGLLTSGPGQLAVAPLRDPDRARDAARLQKWDQGTAELWICPQFDWNAVTDFSPLIVMQREPFIEGFHGSLLVFYTKSRQIAFMLNGAITTMAASPPLSWPRGSWHHLAVSWGPGGMRMYVDGRSAATNPFTGGPNLPTRDVVVGNHAWTVQQGRPANTIVDDLRISRRQRTDSEIAASATLQSAIVSDADTIALEHFDGLPLQPISLVPAGEPWNRVQAGRGTRLTVRVPVAPRTNARMSYRIETPGGAVVRAGQVACGSAATVELGAIRLTEPGFYRVPLRETATGKSVDTGSGWVRVVRESGTPKPSPLFGASACYIDSEDREAYFRMAAAAGVRSLRLPFEWAEIEPADGRFVWAKYDRIVGWAARYGVELIPTFIWENPQPAWAGQGQAKEGFDSERYPPQDLGKWSDFVYRVVSRYKDRIHWWIPANEPNLSRYWAPKPDPVAYTQLLKATWTAARRADPNAKLLGLSASGIPLQFMEECFRAGALQYCDAVGIHPYICPHSTDERLPIDMTDPRSPQGTFIEGLRAAKALIVKYGGRQKLWLDEAGQPYRHDFIAPLWGVSENQAAVDLTKIYIESLASGAVDRVLWFSFAGPDYGSFALVRPDDSPTLPLAAYTAAGNMLAGAAAAPGASSGSEIVRRTFARSGHTVTATWRVSGKSALSLHPGEHAFDVYGFPIPERRIALSSAPVYIVR